MVNTCVSYVLCRVVILVYVAVLLRGLRHVTRTVQDAPRTIGTTSQQTETQVQTIDNMNHSRRVGSRQHVQAKLMTPHPVIIHHLPRLQTTHFGE